MPATEPLSSNRVVPLTGSGAAAIAVLRIIGVATEDFLAAHLSSPVHRGQLAYGRLHDHERTIDDAIVSLARDGQSAELNLHGGPWIVRSALELCERNGFARARLFDEAGLLDASAVDGADWLEGEMLRALPLATTELAVRSLLAQPAAWRALMADARSDRQSFDVNARAILEDRSGHWLLNPPSVAMVGIPNAGKSTLANALYERNRSITADIPGTTRDWVADLAVVDGLAVLLHDMPGFHAASDPLEQHAIALARERLRSTDLVLLVLDGSCLERLDQQELQAAYPQALTVINKADRLRHPQSGSDALRTTAITAMGVDALRRAIAKRFQCNRIDPSRAMWWTEETRQLLVRALADPDVFAACE